MRSVSWLMLAWLPVGALFVQESRAEDWTRWHLPEGALARLGKGSIGRGDRAVAYSPDGARLAVASDIGIWLYDANTGAEIALFTGHTDGVSSVAFSPDGATLASGSGIFDRTVRLWDVASGRQTALLKGHTHWVTSVAFSPDGTTLTSGGEDKTVRLWNVASRQQIALLEGHTEGVWSVAFSPDGTTLASGSGDGTVLLWDMSPYVTPLLATAIDASPSLPGQTALLDNYPNPFNSRTRIAYRLAAPGPVRLSIYNALGQPVRTLVDGSQAAGEHRVGWDARDGRGAAVSSGVYVTRLEYPGGVQTRRLLHLR